MTRARVTLTSTIRASSSLVDTVHASSSLAGTVRASSSLVDTVRASASLTTQARIAATGAGVLPGVVADGEATVVDSSPAYVIVVKTDNAGTSEDNQFTLPAVGTYDIDWGDGTEETRTGAATHTYPAAGTYTISVTGGLGRVLFNNGGDCLKLLDIASWGPISWSSMLGAYYGCANLVGTAADVPDLASVASFINCFNGCTAFVGDVGGWDVSGGTSLANMFLDCAAFNSDISGWDVSSATSLVSVLRNANSFNHSLAAWPLRVAGVNLVNSLVSAAPPAGMSAENYSRTLIGWANRVATLGGPTGSSLGASQRRYTSTVYGGTPYDNAVAARAFLVLPVVDGGAGWTISGDALI